MKKIKFEEGLFMVFSQYDKNDKKQQKMTKKRSFKWKTQKGV